MSANRGCFMIGVDPQEIRWLRLLVKLLRHPDPLAPELARQALEYVEAVVEAAQASGDPQPAAQM